MIENDEFDTLVHLAEKSMHDGHGLMDTAIAWMLRKMGKQDSVGIGKGS